MSGLGTDYEGDPTSPTLTSGAQVLPGTVVVSEVRPNQVTVEGSDGTTATAIASAEAVGLGLLGEYITYSYVLDAPTLQAIADTRLASNIATVAASVEVSAVARYRPWVDYFVGDRLWVDIDAGLPAGWYRIEKISMRLSSESAGPRFVVDVGRAVVTEDAAVADRLAKLLYAGLIDSATGLNTSGNTGQASTTIIIQSDALPAHTHTISDVSDLDTGGISLGGDLSGTIRQATVERWRGYEIANTGDPNEGDMILWNAANRLAEWAPPPLAILIPYTVAGTLEVGAGTFRFPVTRSMTIVRVRVSVATAPTGSSVIFDVNLNGTTIYTTQANRPTITDGGNDSGTGVLPNVIDLTEGDYLTVDVDQIGSTDAGSDAVLVIEST